MAKLWHVLRLTPLPKVTTNKLNSIIFQYIVDGKGMQIKKDVFYLPKDQGGLGLLHVSVQQQTLQKRFITALLYHDQRPTIPGYLYQLISHTLQMETNIPHTETILLFKQVRAYKNNLKEGALKLLLETMNNLLETCLPDLSQTHISANSCLTLPLNVIFKDWEESNTLRYLRNPTATKGIVQDFFNINHSSRTIQHKSREECRYSQILSNIKRDIRSNQLQYQESFARLLHQNNTPVPAHQDEVNNTADLFKHNNITLWQHNNKEIRQLLLKHLPLEFPKDYNNNISRSNWKAFYRSRMHQSPRNVWLKLIYNKIPSRQFLYHRKVKDVDNDRCSQCNEIEDARHLLMECGNKYDVWEAIFKEHLSQPTIVNTHRINKDLQSLSLSRYLIKTNLKINIYDLFATTIRVIWTHHFFVHFKGTPFDPPNVIKRINQELETLSTMDSIVL